MFRNPSGIFGRDAIVLSTIAELVAAYVASDLLFSAPI
jgi:hypothetical protein